MYAGSQIAESAAYQKWLGVSCQENVELINVHYLLITSTSSSSSTTTAVSTNITKANGFI